MSDNLIRTTRVTLLGIVCGCVLAVVAVGFVEAVIWLNDQLMISPRSRMLAGDGNLLTIMTLVVPTLGGLVAGLLCQAIDERRPHGPADAIQSAQSLSGTMSVKSGVLTGAASCIALGTGASVGQYGPLVHIGASVGSWFSRLFGDSRYLGTIGIGCGTAAAIATAFNAPIAGLVFAHEVILRHYSLRAFAPITVAATLGYVAANIVFERPPLFRIEDVAIGSPWEFIVFAVIGIVGAVVAMTLMRLMLYADKLSWRMSLPGPAKTALAGLMVGIVALQIPEVLGIGKEVLRFAVIEHAFTASELTLILIAKLLLTALCLGFGIAGGIFSPSLLIGVLFGALVGTGAESIFGELRSPVAIYAICGMVAVTSPVVGAPLTAILIVFELTRNYDLATAAMVSVAFANLIGYRIFGRSLFDVQLKGRGFDLSFGRDKVIVEQRKVGEFVSDEYTRLFTSQSLQEARDALLAAQRSEAYVVDDKGVYAGTIYMQQLASSLSDTSAANEHVVSIARLEKLVLSPSDSVWNAMEKMHDFVGESIPVVKDGVLAGVVFEASIVSAYLNALHQVRTEENAAA